MKKLLFINQHLSTGGSVQFTLKQIESCKDKYDISVIEISYYGEFEVQRKKIDKLVPLFPLFGDQTNLISTIRDINPDILYFQEVPTSFIKEEIYQQLNDRYEIWVTTHSSLTKPEDFKYLPDRIICVNKWQVKLFKDLPCNIDIWEYPIEKKSVSVGESRMKLGFPFHKYKKNILNCGLFTPGKNQGELFEIARKNPQSAYHFVGNQAPNFKDYWQPLMDYKPDNCIVWGEMDTEEVDLFYQSCDEMYFCSKFELNPIVVKEALSYNLPVKMYKLPTYLDDYDNNPLIEYINKQPKFNINYVNGCYLEVVNGEGKYDVSFINPKTGELVYKTILGINEWGKANIQYFVDWKIEISQNGNLIETHNLDLKGKRVLISFESGSLGDTLAWFPYVEEFRKKYSCKVVVGTFLNSLFKDTYPDIEFTEPGSIVKDIHAQYNIGWFYKGEEIDSNRHPLDPKKYPLQKTICDILGLEYKEIKPKLKLPDIEKKDVITIGFHATNQQKYWNNSEGWQDVVNHINLLGKTPLIVSSEGDGYMGNNHPYGVHCLNKGSLENLITVLSSSKLFVGVGSGLSWLAWACNIPVILISGFSEDYTEMKNCIRIGAPDNVCRGCFNKKKLDPSKWLYCPENKDFECSKSISSERVIKEINKILVT